MMKLTAKDLKRFRVIDEIVPEPAGGAHINPKAVYKTLDRYIKNELEKYIKMSGDEITRHRYNKFRNIDKDYMVLL